MKVVRHSDVEFIETPNGNTSGGIATPKWGATEVNVIRQRELAGGKNPPHRHNREEVMVLLAGEVTVAVGDETQTLMAGDAVIVPANTVHHIANTGRETAEWLIISSGGRIFITPNGEEVIPPWSL